MAWGVIRNLDFQYWANFRVSSSPSFSGGSFITSRWRMFLAWSSMSKSSPTHVMDWHEILSRRNLSHKLSIFASCTYSKILLHMFESFFDLATSLPVPEQWSKVDSSRLTQHLVRFETPIRHSYPPRGLWSEICWASSSSTNPILLRRHWADWRKWLCETTTLLSSNHRGSESIIFLLLYFSKILGLTHSLLGI